SSPRGGWSPLLAMEFMLESEVKPTSITFMATKGKQESYFDVFNRGEMHQIYKIKTTNVKGYKITPPKFSIGVNERQRVFVNFLGLSDKPVKDRISVVFAHHANVKNTVEQAWHAAKQITNTPEKRAYVNILFKEDPRRSIAEVNVEVNDAQKSVMGNKSQTLRPQTGSSRMEPSGSSGRDSDGSYYGGIPAPPKGTTKAPKRSSGLSNYSTEPSEETNEEGNNRSGTKGKKKSVSQTVEATEEGGETLPPPIVVKPRSRRKVSAPPPEDEEEAPPSPVKTAIPVIRRKKSPARVAVAAEPAEDEMAEAPIAPKKTRKPVQQTEEEEEEAPPPLKPAHKPRSRRKTHSSTPPPRPSTQPNDEDDGTQIGTKKVISPVRTPRSSSSNPKPKSRREVSGSSGTIDPLESIMSDSKIVYIIQQGDGNRQNEDEEEESDKKTRKKSKDSKKKTKKRKEEEEEDE
ncbi:hypothetical protein PENTCL1PPCAC_23238, partial [Pristionchus entomophagus]